jgi:hypothetical protein
VALLNRRHPWRFARSLHMLAHHSHHLHALTPSADLPTLSSGWRRLSLAVTVVVACSTLSACGTRFWAKTKTAAPAPAVAADAGKPAPSSTAPSFQGGGAPYKEELVALTADQQLVRFVASYPARLTLRQRLTGLPDGDAVADIDYRVARGVLYGITQQGRVVTIDPWTAKVTVVSTSLPAVSWGGQRVGMDFNPSVDRIRVVSAGGMNLRLHPDTGAVIDSQPQEPGLQTDKPLAYVSGDPNAGKAPEVTAVAYTYNKDNEKITTLFGIDRTQGVLVRHGSVEGVQPFVSPDSGRLSTVGALGLGKLLDVTFDISDLRYLGLAAVRTQAEPRSVLVDVNLQTGAATALGVIGDGEPVIGLAIVP